MLLGQVALPCLVDTREENSREHLIFTALQNIIVKSLVLNLNIQAFKKNKKTTVKQKANSHLFQMQTSMFKTFLWVKRCYVETRRVIHLSLANTVTCLYLKISETIFETSQTISPQWQICFLFF